MPVSMVGIIEAREPGMNISPIQKECIVNTWRKNTFGSLSVFVTERYTCPRTETKLLFYLIEKKKLLGVYHKAMYCFSHIKQPLIKFKIGTSSRRQPVLMRLSQPSLGEPCKWYPLSGLGLAVILLLFICPIQLLIFSLTKVACYFFSKYVLHPFSTILQSIMIIITFVINIIHIFFI